MILTDFNIFMVLICLLFPFCQLLPSPNVEQIPRLFFNVRYSDEEEGEKNNCLILTKNAQQASFNLKYSFLSIVTC